MSDQFPDRERLEELLVASTDDSFSGPDREELNKLLRESVVARSHAAGFLFLDAALSESLGSGDAARQYSVQETDGRAEVVSFPGQRTSWIAAAALVLLSTVIVASWWNGSAQRNPVALVQSASRASGLEAGGGVGAGDWVRFEKGRVVLRFQSGAKLAVEGPARFQITGGNGAEMVQGRATVRVPGAIKGFTLDTPSEQIVDLGTSFGVDVESDGATSVAVFEGEVELRGRQHDSGPQQLSAGSSVRIAHHTEPPRLIPYEVSRFLETWQVSFGVEAVEGDLRVARPDERAIPGAVVDGGHLLVFPERESVELPAGFVLTTTEPGEYRSHRGLKREVTLDAPIVVDSYLIQFNPGGSRESGATQRFSGKLKFDRPVAGLLLQRQMLDDSDAVLGLISADFGGVFRRGINGDDEVSLAADRRTLMVSFDVINGVDQIRVLVASGFKTPQPDSLP